MIAIWVMRWGTTVIGFVLFVCLGSEGAVFLGASQRLNCKCCGVAIDVDILPSACCSKRDVAEDHLVVAKFRAGLNILS